MTLIQTVYPNHIALRTRNQEACFVEIGILASAFEKSATELKHKQKLLKCKSTVYIATLNVRTLNRIDQLLVLTEHNIDIVCVQKHRYHYSEVEIKHHDSGNGWTFISASAWKNSVNVVIGDVGMHLSPRALKSLNSIKKIQPKMMIVMFNDNPTQRSCPAIILQMRVIKRISSPSLMSYPPSFVVSRNTTFLSSVETLLYQLRHVKILTIILKTKK